MRNLADFIGRFDVSRVIEDARGMSSARFEGTADIAAHAGGAQYCENGAMIIADQRFVAERRYLWQPSGPRIDVLFDDGRAFHDFDPELGGLAREHLCGSDMYRGGYDFSQWPRWSVTWNVQGPRKDYRSVTWYTPFALAE